MDIVVLCGGISSEREISIISSEKVAGALKENGHNIALVDVFFGAENEIDLKNDFDIDKEAARLRCLSAEPGGDSVKGRPFFGPGVLKACKKADIVFMGLHGGSGEDGSVQAAFDLLGIKYTGSGFKGSCIAMSKSLTKEVLSGSVPMAEGRILRKGTGRECSVKAPCVIKPSNGGSSLGVTIVNEEKDFEAALEKAFKYDDTVLVEEFIKGRELTQGVLGDRALPAIEIKPPEDGEYDYENKYNGLTQEICPAPIEENVLEEMSGYSLRIGEILGLSVYYRIDYMLSDEGQLYCLEANTLPGMTAASLIPCSAKEAGFSYNELCEEIIRLSMEKYE